MAETKIYKRFYSIIATGVDEVQTLINPFLVTASTFNVTQGQSLVENDVPLVKESIGLYYALLDGTLYNSDDKYDVVFSVNYLESTPSKDLKSTFKLTPVLTPKGSLSFDIEQPMVIQVQVNNSTFQF